MTLSKDRFEPAPVTEEGTVLDDRFQFERRLGEDPIAEVWKAADLQLDRPVVLRLLHPHLMDGDGVLDRFRREALAAAQLSHGHVANLFDVAVRDDVAYTVGEYVDGPSLSRIIREGPLAPAVVAAIGQQAASGLAAAHEAGIIHRDVRPEKLLIGRDGRVRVVDFGSARLPDPRREALDEVEGGPETYLAPEQLAGAVEGTDRGDVYALGRTLLKSLTGSRVLPADPRDDASLLGRVISAIPGLPVGAEEHLRLRDQIVGAIDPDPAARPSAARLAESLQEICGHRGDELLRPLVAEISPSEYGRQP